jgi:hypothetical protein
LTVISERKLQLDALRRAFTFGIVEIAVAQTRWDVLYSAMLLAGVARNSDGALAKGQLEDILEMPVSHQTLRLHGGG